MAKKKVEMSEASTSMIDDLMNCVRTTLGGLSADEAKEKARGVLIPTFAERYLRDSNVYFVEKIEMYEGGYASGKSSYGFHVGASFIDAGGAFFIIDTENKTSFKTVESNIGKARVDTGRVQLLQTGSMYSPEAKKDKDDVADHLKSWQSVLTALLAYIREKDTKDPVFILVDSMLGAAGAEAFAMLEEEGQFQGRSTVDMAQAASLAKYFKSLSGQMIGLPVLVAFTNQLTKKIQVGGYQRPGAEEWTSPGGEKPKMASHLILQFRQGKKEETVEEAGKEINIKIKKNSFGGEERSIKVSFSYMHMKDATGEVALDDAGHPIRMVEWDWIEATGKLLQEAFVEKEHLSQDARKTFKLTSPRANKFDCEALGLQAVSHKELGAAFEANPDVMRQVELITKMGIQYFNVMGAAPEYGEHGDE
jgi:RecA/RadA recombinase